LHPPVRLLNSDSDKLDNRHCLKRQLLQQLLTPLNLANLLDKIAGLIRPPIATGQPNKGYETDRQMLIRVARQFAVLFVVILWLDDIINLIVGIVHFLFELLHLFMESIEGFIEEVLEHLLHTGHHDSEIIIVNGVLVLIALGLYRLYRAWPPFYRRWRRNRQAGWLRYKRRKVHDWRSLSQSQKLKLTAAYLTGIALMLFWLTL
jgi:hypothetical protein